MTQLRAGLIGLGEIGSLYEAESWRGSPSTHAEAFEAVDGVQLAAACDLSADRRAAFSAKRPGLPVYGNAQEMVASQALDIVAIATPHATHADLVETCAAAGVRGLIIEKPLATDLAQADRIIGACDEHGVVASVSYLRRWDRNFRRIKQALDGGEWGELLYLCGHMSRFKPYGWQAEAAISGGFLTYDPTHLIELYLWLAGKPQWVSAQVERRDKSLRVEDFVLATFGFEGGARAHLQVDAYRDYFEFSVDLQLSRGRMEFTSGLHDNPYRLFLPQAVDARWSFMRQEPWEPEDAGALQVLQIEELVQCLRGAAQPSVTLAEARQVVEATIGIYESARLGGAKVGFPLETRENPLVAMVEERGL